MNESAAYTETDIQPFRNRIDELREIVQHDAQSGNHPVAMTTLLERKLDQCGLCLNSSQQNVFFTSSTEKGVKNLQDSLAVLDVGLVPVHTKLVNLRRQLVALAAKSKPAKADIKPLQEELRKLDS